MARRRHCIIDGFVVGLASQTAEGCTGPLLIGQHKTDETTCWNGAIDDVRIYDVVLTPQQVSQLARE
ncbi:MAG: hypothetical protein JXB18_15510 [Sedimentisphaerales bacterium]|nr:hypothetical protein [Sedimentisphaerales bacterium]